MADLKSLLGDKYKEDMTLADVLALDIELPKPDLTGLISKEHFDRVASEAANYKKQLKAKMTEDEQKAAEDAEKWEAIIAENRQLKAERAIQISAKKLIAMGYDEELATTVATALNEGDTETVLSCQAKFIEAQKKAVIADAVKNTPTPPATASNTDKPITKEAFRQMSPLARLEFSQKNPEEYAKIYGGN